MSVWKAHYADEINRLDKIIAELRSENEQLKAHLARYTSRNGKKTDRVYRRIKELVIHGCRKHDIIDATMLAPLTRKQASDNLYNFYRLGLLERVNPGNKGRGREPARYRLKSP